MRCLDEPELEALLAGDLDEPTEHAVRAHIACCDTCRGQIEQIDANLDLVEPLQRAMRDSNEPTPRRVGRYQIIRRLGAGATSIVYLARQQHPRRTVAIKLLREQFSTGETMERFTREANMLARLQHPGIATIIDAGAAEVHTEDGFISRRPFLAMEYVEGQRLDVFARRHELTIEHRLQLIAQVADAVHHAHLKGVIHRDLKPSNILVAAPTDDGASAQPKILDFGVARAIASAWDVRSETTESTGLIGTLPYMSPEQIECDLDRIDVRSDVYALGVLAFELLTGELPHDVRNRSIIEAARRITTDDPKRIRTIEPKFRGDIDAIMCKALARDPHRRYESASAFADDLRRHLARQPVHARSPTLAYHFGRFAMRNRVLVGGFVLFIAALVIGVGVLNLHARKAERARDIAEQRLSDALDANMELVDVVAATLNDQPGTFNARLVLAEEIHRYLTDLNRVHPEQPRVQSSLWISKRLLSALLRQSGETDRAAQLMQESFAMMKQAFERDPDDHELRFEYAYSLRYLMGPPDMKLDRARESAQMLVALHEDHPDNPVYRREAAVGLRALAIHELRAGHHVAAAEHLDRAEQLLESLRDGEPDNTTHSVALVDIALVRSQLLERTGRLDDARQRALQALGTAEQLCAQFPQSSRAALLRIDVLLHLAELALKQNNPQRCQAYAQQCTPDARRLLAADPEHHGLRRRLQHAEKMIEGAQLTSSPLPNADP